MGKLLVEILLLPGAAAVVMYWIFLALDPTILYTTAVEKRRACRRRALFTFPMFAALALFVNLLFNLRP